MFFQKWQRFLYGRYGSDGLNLFLLAAGLVLTLFGSFFRPLIFLADVFYLGALFRAFSRNIPARQREYAAFLRVWGPVQNWLAFQRRRFADRKLYRYFKCPHCKQDLRAPRGRGRIEVTCQRCHTVFITKT